MESKTNVIHLGDRLKAKSGRREISHVKSQEPVLSKNAAAVVDMTERRNEILSKERRKVKRTILTEFVGAFAVVPSMGLMKVAIYDISENGIAFDLDFSSGHFAPGEEVAMRVYLNHQTYFPFLVQIQNSRAINEEKVWRHGGHFVKGSINDLALHHFVKFIETVSASLVTDRGDILVSRL